MAKTKGRPRKPGGEGTLVRIDADIVSRARYLSAREGKPISEMFSQILRPVIDKQWAQATREVLGEEQRAAKDANARRQQREVAGIFDDQQPEAAPVVKPRRRGPKGTGESSS